MKKKFLRIILIIFLMLPLIAAAHFFVFPQETRCILIRFADFEKKGNIYFRAGVAPEKIGKLQNLCSIAEKRVNAFWGSDQLLDYSVIYCDNEKDFNKYGSPGAPAATQLKMGAYVVLKNESIDTDIIAHEISHTVLYNNIGWYKTKFRIPTWFDEGLAMQVDNRDYYAIDSLIAKKNGGLQLPDVTLLKKPADFHSGSTVDIMLNYSTAKYIVYEWLKTHSLHNFINTMISGDDFETAYLK